MAIINNKLKRFQLQFIIYLAVADGHVFDKVN